MRNEFLRVPQLTPVTFYHWRAVIQLLLKHILWWEIRYFSKELWCTFLFIFCCCFGLVWCLHSSLLSSLLLRLIQLMSVVVAALLSVGTWLPWGKSLRASIPPSMVISPRSDTLGPKQTQSRFSIITHEWKTRDRAAFFSLWFQALVHPVLPVALLALIQEATWERNQTQRDECSEMRALWHCLKLWMSCSESLLHPWLSQVCWPISTPIFTFSFFNLRTKETWLIWQLIL